MRVVLIPMVTTDASGAKWNTVFVPTTPNPTTGFLQLVPADAVVQTGYSVEDGIKMVMSLGVLVPDGAGPAPATTARP